MGRESDTSLHRFQVRITYEGTILPQSDFIVNLYNGATPIFGHSDANETYDTVKASGDIDSTFEMSLGPNQSIIDFRVKLFTREGGSSICTCEEQKFVPVSLVDPEDFGPSIAEATVNDPVNAINGNMFLLRKDFVMGTDLGIPLQFIRYYNSYSFITPGMPYKMWRHSYQYNISFDSSVMTLPCDTCNVTVTEPSGRGIEFRQSMVYDTISTDPFVVDTLTFVPATGIHYKLKYDSTADEYTMTDDTDRRYIFEYISSAYRLTTILDRNDNEVSLAYSNGNLTEISGACNEILRLDYDVTGELLTALKDGLYTTLVTYTYDYDNFLDTVYYADGAWEAYSPGASTNDDLRIIKTENSDGFTWFFEYDTNHLISAAYNDGTSGEPVERVDIVYSRDTISGGVFVQNIAEVTHNENSNQKLKYTSLWSPVYDRTFLMKVEDPNDTDYIKEFSYDGNGNRVLTYNPNNRIDSVSYDSRGNVVSFTRGYLSSSPITTCFEYDPHYNLLTKISTQSVQDSTEYRETVFNRDSNGNLEELVKKGLISPTEDPYEYTTSFDYNALGQLVKIDGPRTNVADTVGFSYRSGAHCLEYVYYPNGDTIAYGQRNSFRTTIPYVIDQNNIKTSYEYDIRNRVNEITELDQTTLAGITTLSYTVEGKIASVLMPLGDSIVYAYDDHNWLETITNTGGDYLKYYYNENSKPDSIEYYTAGDTLRKIERYGFNYRNQLERVYINDQQDGVAYEYYPMGNVKYILTPSALVQDAFDTVFYEYDIHNRLESETHIQVKPNPNDNVIATTEYEYNVHDNLTKVTDPEGYVIEYDYDDLGNLIYDSCGMTGVTVYEYDEAGNLLSKTDANDNEVSYAYDYMNRLESIDYTDNSLDVDYTYDLSSAYYGNGRLCKEETQDVTILYYYNPYGLVSKETQTYSSGSYSTSYVYDKNKRLSQILYPSGIRYYYGYDQNGNVNKIQSKFGTGQLNTIIDSIYYEPFGGIKRLVYNNGIKTDYDINERYLIDGISTGSDNVVRRSYTYDTLSNVNSIYDSLSIQSNKNTDFKYDNLNRLIYATSDEYPSTGDPRQYSYEKNGNRKTRCLGPIFREYSYDLLKNRLEYYTDTSSTDTTWFVYDSCGNTDSIITISGSTDFDFDQNNRLISVNDTIEYSYNTRSQRYETQIGTTGTMGYIYSLSGIMLANYYDDEWEYDYIYLYGQPIAKVWAENTSTDTLVDTLIDPPIESMGASTMSIGDPPPSNTVTTDWTIYYFHNDHLGTPLVLTDSNKTVCWKTGYFPFGSIHTEYVSTTNNIRFQGQLHDRETNNYYNMCRTYDPQIGRYLSPDPIGLAGGINFYSYAGSNPINNIDPLGLDFFTQANKLITLDKEIREYTQYLDPINFAASQAMGYAATFIPENIKSGRWAFTGFGEDAVDDWAAKYNKSKGWAKFGYGCMGSIAALWTEDNWFQTTSMLATAYGLQASGITAKGPWLGKLEFHPAHHGNTGHLQLIVRIGESKNFNLLIPGKYQLIYWYIR